MSKTVKVIFIIFLALFAIIFLVAIGLFIFNFYKSNVSTDVEHWGQTGDYFGGILNPIISLMSLIVLAYITLRISEIEHERARQNIAPLPDIIVEDYQTYLRIDLRNQGIGPMVIKNIQFISSKNQTDKIINHLPTIQPEIISQWWDMRYNLIIPSQTSKTLLALRPMDTGIVNPGETILASYKLWGQMRPQIRELLKDITIEIKYVDNIDPSKEIILTKKLDAFEN